MIEGEIGRILEELGRELSIPNLGPDEHGTCLIRLKNGVKVQLEMLKGKDYILVATDLGEVPPGRFRVDLFESALNHNVSDNGGVATLGFSKRTSHLILFERLYIQGLNGMKVRDFIDLLAEKAIVWKDAITNGRIPRVGEEAQKGGGGIFGLMR